MTIKKQLRRYIGRKATKRLYKAMPWLNGAIAFAVIAFAVRGTDLTDLVKAAPDVVGGLKEWRKSVAAGVS